MEHIVEAVSIRWYNACAYYAVSLAQGLKRNGRRVTVAGIDGTPAVEKAGKAGLDILPLAPRGQGLVAQLRRASACRKFALANGVTLVNAHAGEDHLVWAVALRGTGIPLVRTSGNQIPPKNHPAARFLYSKTAGVIVSCNTIRNFYTSRFGMRADDIPVINGGVDTDFFKRSAVTSPGRESLGIPGDSFLFGILARYSPDKGHEHFFRAAGDVARRCPSAHFLVAGWNAQLSGEDMRTMADDAGILGRTVFAGRQNDTRELISLLDAGVITSVRSETICRIAMEYMAMGVPVVASDTNVIPEVVKDGETGIVVNAGNPDMLARAMISLLEDRDLSGRYAANGVETACKDLSLEAFAAKTFEVYERILR